jgi:dipeptidyl aminopeptidase/acylaminoacyl peptidase
MLAAMRALSGEYREASQPPGDARLPYLVACWPVLDPLARYAYARAHGLQRLVEAHHAFWRDEAEMEQANPLRILQRGEAVDLPPALLLQGTADANFDYRNTVDFAQAYRGAGGHAELELYEGAPHAFIKEEEKHAAAQPALERMRDFVISHCEGHSAD